jgi:hypothetical protein
MISPWIAPVILSSIVLVITVVLRERDKRKHSEKKIANPSK